MQISDTEYGATSYQRRTEPGNNSRNIASNQMNEQINIALEQKGPEFLSLGREACRRRLTSEEAYASIKSDEE